MVLPVLLGIGGCFQTQFPRELRLGVEGVPNQQLPVWPPPPELARYQYAGQLWGVENFVITEAGKKEMEGAHQAQQALMWFVGYDPSAAEAHRKHSEGLQRPLAGVADKAGRIYVTDMGQQAVVVFDPSSAELRVWKQASPKSTFVAPSGIVIGAAQQILVADADLGRVIRLSPTGEPVGEFGDEELQRPTGMARDAARGRIYVADTQAHDIKVFDDSGKLIKKFGRSGRMPGEFNAPTHLAFAQDRLYVADTLNARIQVFDSGGEFLFTFGQRGVRVGNLVRPKGVAVDGLGNIYVVESLHDYLLVYDSKGEFLMPIGGTGKEIGQFYLPSGVWTDANNRVFVADMFNGRVMIFRFLGGGK
ncbi:MAG: SMP-30/gluconolactonase/LRE family protein [Magnetococcales bacterium]|nr:SMP-30/gluconolactonase/LRE family protein [Magnetococcales bacterium]